MSHETSPKMLYLTVFFLRSVDSFVATLFAIPLLATTSENGVQKYPTCKFFIGHTVLFSLPRRSLDRENEGTFSKFEQHRRSSPSKLFLGQ